MAYYDLKNVDVMVVDSNRHMLALLRDVLTALGVARVRTSDNPAAALQALRVQPADLIVTEWNLEPMSGPDFLRQLRDPASSGDCQVPVLLVTGARDSASVMQARDCGVTEFLGKPVSARALYDRIVAIVEQPRPFVNAECYKGPDRRRRPHDPYAGPERRDRGAGHAGRAVKELVS